MRSSLGFIHPQHVVAQRPATYATSTAIEVETADPRAYFRNQYLRPSLLGAIDGLITSFVILAGGIAGNVVKSSVMIIGISSLVADGLSMGVSEAISSRAEANISWKQTFSKGFACFLSFVCFGSFPLIGFFVGNTVFVSGIISTAVFFCMLFIVGNLRVCISKESYVHAISEVVGLGTVAAGVAYGIASIKFEP